MSSLALLSGSNRCLIISLVKSDTAQLCTVWRWMWMCICEWVCDTLAGEGGVCRCWENILFRSKGGRFIATSFTQQQGHNVIVMLFHITALCCLHFLSLNFGRHCAAKGHIILGVNDMKVNDGSSKQLHTLGFVFLCLATIWQELARHMHPMKGLYSSIQGLVMVAEPQYGRFERGV